MATVSVRYMVILCLCTLAAGTVSIVLTKLLYQISAQGLSSCPSHGVKKPYWAALMMFIGEALCLIMYRIQQRSSSSSSSAPAITAVLLDPSSSKPPQNILGLTDLVSQQDDSSLRSMDTRGHLQMSHHVETGQAAKAAAGVSAAADPINADAKVRPPLWYFAAFCTFDLTATVISGVGLLWVDASLFQMLRGANVVFAAIGSKLLIGKVFSWRQVSSLCTVVVGLAIVGLSGFLKNKFSPSSSSDSNDATSGEVATGITLILISAVLAGVQSVLEEKYMKASKRFSVEPLELVGWEGLFGMLISGLIVLPIAQHVPMNNSAADCGGVVENTLDTLTILAHSAPVSIIMVAYMLNIALFNWLSLTVSKVLSAVHRQLINAARTLTIWAVDLLLFYTVSESLGEYWTVWSWMELGGFVVLIGGMYMYATAPPSVPAPAPDDPAPEAGGDGAGGFSSGHYTKLPSK